MDESKQQVNSHEEDERFLSRSYTSKEDFVKEYQQSYHGKAKAKDLYFLILTELLQAISIGNIDRFKRFVNLLDYISGIESSETLEIYHNDRDNPIKKTNFVVLACKHNKIKILNHVFNNIRIFNSSWGVGKNSIAPDSKDETNHDAFYYAIRSGNTELLDTLITKWPNDYFATRPEELDVVLSKAYEELKFRNVLLSDEMGIFVENKLINLRFFSNPSAQVQSVKSTLSNIRERVNLVLEKISLLQSEYLNEEKVDEKFLFVARFIAQNIHVLKRQLKSTYDRLPWEEIEFCLVAFVSSHLNEQEINLFYRFVLNKQKLLSYLENFAKRLENEMNILGRVSVNKLADIPKSRREDVVAKIISSDPQFEELYIDYQHIRDIHSLEKIHDYLNLALSINPKEREGQLIITRALQVIGEYLKNTLESPKLSNSTSELILLSLPKNSRKIIINLRNSLSHAYSLFKRTEIEENTDVNFFIGVQSDATRIHNVIADILFNSKIKTIRILLKKIIDSESLDEIKEVAEILGNVQLDKITSKNFKATEHEKLEKLIRELSDAIPDKTNYESEILNKIEDMLNFSKTKSEGISADYIIGLVSLKSLTTILEGNTVDHNDVRTMKFYANKTLENISPQMEPLSLREVVELTLGIFHLASSRAQDDNRDNINRIVSEIVHVAEFGVDDMKWITKLRKKLHEKGSFILIQNQKQICNVTEKKYENLLASKLSELKTVLQIDSSSELIISSSYKTNKPLQTVVEMLVLDIMSILSRSEKHLENNLFFLDDNSPLLTGKFLRNHLAHGNSLLDILLFDPSRAVILNAEKFISENVVKSKKKIGKLVRYDPSKLRSKFDECFVTINNQEGMFAALEKGNLEDLFSYLRKGTDINARNIHSQTALHFAARGPSLTVVKFVLDQTLRSDANAKDMYHQSPLHIAAASGRKDTVQFLVTEAAANIDDLDNSGKTPLHMAAKNGFKNTVEILLRNNADTNTKDVSGFSPLHYAVQNNHIDVVEVLLKKEVHVDMNEASAGFTLLHFAAEFGHLEVVEFLLKRGANVNARNDKQGIPLHTAALNGHLKVVNALVLEGADVDARVIDGCTPLHYAVENGHEKIAEVLLKNGANANVTDKAYYNTPLHYAAQDGHEQIVKVLLENKANPNVATSMGITPLHFAVKGGHLNIIVSLLKHRVNIHAKDVSNRTPLHFAAEFRRKEIAELLLRNGAEIGAKTEDGMTPLHLAASVGNDDIIDLLIQNKARINVATSMGTTPLHFAVKGGHFNTVASLLKHGVDIHAKDGLYYTPMHFAAEIGHKGIAELLLRNGAEIDAKSEGGITPLHLAVSKGNDDVLDLLIQNEAVMGSVDNTVLLLAVEAGHTKIVEILLANGADVNIKNSYTPLLSAIKHNHREMVEILIANKAIVGMHELGLAVFSGFTDIVDILLKNVSSIDHVMDPEENATLLHLSAKRGDKKIVDALIKKGAKVNAMTIHRVTPLYFAAQEGHEEIAEVLIANKADVNTLSDEGAPIHIAAGRGHDNVIHVLLSNGAKINIKDHKKRTALELAVGQGRFPVVKTLLKFGKSTLNLNAKGNDDWTVLHIASQESSLEIIEYLVYEGCNINAKNTSGSKPIHIAAREGFKDAVEFFLSRGLSIDEPGVANQTLLHYASQNNRLEVVKYLIAEGAKINAKDDNGLTAIHIAAFSGHANVITFLLENGAVYNAVDRFHRKPLDMSKNRDIRKLLASTEQLFEAVKHASSSEVENCINAGAFVNAKKADTETTPLHYAAWKGCNKIVNTLLQNKANSNALCSKGFTPLHYSAKFAHLESCKILLYHGAVYNVASVSGKVPSDFSIDEHTRSLFNLIDKAFEKIKRNNSQVIDDLATVKDNSTLRAVMNARNRENQTLIAAAAHSNFLKIGQLKAISQGDVTAKINEALVHLNLGSYQLALNILNKIFVNRKALLGPDNLATLDIQSLIADVLYKQGHYQEAFNRYQDIFLKRKEMLGLNDKQTLATRSSIALVLHRQGKDEEAFDIFQEVYQKQKEILGPNHRDTTNTQFHLALVLNGLKKFDEALRINREVFERRRATLGKNDPFTISAQNNIAMVLANQGKHEEALKIYDEVLIMKKRILGTSHTDTLRTLQNIAATLYTQKKHQEALKTFEEVLSIQKKALVQNHPETLRTQYNMANVLFDQGKCIAALKVFKQCIDPMKVVFGPGHPSVLDISMKMEAINFKMKLEGSSTSEVFHHLQNEINIASSKGDAQTVLHLLKNGADVNDRDVEGRTPLHFAADNGHLNIVNILLKNGADVTQVTNKGNTPLHSATSKDRKEIVETLLKHVGHDRLNDFINAKTFSGGTTSLHVAAKKGFLQVVKCLFNHGASFNIANKEGKIPLQLAEDRKIINLLKLIEQLFEAVRRGDVEVVDRLKALKPDEFSVVTNARNNEGLKLIKVAIINKHENIMSELLKLLKSRVQ